MKSKKAAMEMSMGTIVTIVLLVTVLVLGLIVIQNIFGGATDSIDSINDQIRSEIDNLFNTENQELVVSLGTKHTANIKQGTKDFGFVFGFSPDDPTQLMQDRCKYSIEASISGDYCSKLSGWSTKKVEDWIITGTSNVKFDELKRNSGYALIRLKIPDNIPICLQRFSLSVECPDGYIGKTYFDINIKKKGLI